MGGFLPTDQADPNCFHFIFMFLPHPFSAGPQKKPQTLTVSKSKNENYGLKILIPHEEILNGI